MRQAPLLILAALLFGLPAIGHAAEGEKPGSGELPAKEGCTRLYLFRIKNFNGSGIKPVVKIDGVEIGRLIGDTRVAVYIRPGLHTLETKLSWTNLPIKGGTVQLNIPEKTAELCLQYMAGVKIIGASAYTISAQADTGFVVTDIEASKVAMQNLAPLPVSPDVLLATKP